MSVKVGDIVIYFHSGSDEPAAANQSVCVPAIVVAVITVDCVNLRVFTDSDFIPLWRTSVPQWNSELVKVPYWKEIK